MADRSKAILSKTLKAWFTFDDEQPAKGFATYNSPAYGSEYRN